MTLEEIKQAVNDGKKVYWASKAYEVVKNKHGKWLIVCTLNKHAIGLTWQDGVTLNGEPSEFFIEKA